MRLGLARLECPIWKSLGQTVQKPRGITVAAWGNRSKQLEKEIIETTCFAL